jgi:hypothetical protein
MKLRWIDSKSKRLHEVSIDLDAILKNGALDAPLAGSRLAPLAPDPLQATGEGSVFNAGLRSGPPTTSHRDCWQRRRSA